MRPQSVGQVKKLYNCVCATGGKADPVAGVTGLLEDSEAGETGEVNGLLQANSATHIT